MSTSPLSAEFVAAHGVSVDKPLRDWLTRAAFLAKTRSSAAERARYERWALHRLETAVRDEGHGDAAAVEWARLSPIMPANAPDCTPAMLASADATASNSNADSNDSARAEAAQREALLHETLHRAPLELRSFVTQAFALYDKDVAQHKRSYARVTFLEMLNIAKNLHRLSEKQRQLRAAAALHVPASNSRSSNIVVGASAATPPPVQPPPPPARFLQPPLPQMPPPQPPLPQLQPSHRFVQPPPQQHQQQVVPMMTNSDAPSQRAAAPAAVVVVDVDADTAAAPRVKRPRSRSKEQDLDDYDDNNDTASAAAAADDSAFFVQLARQRQHDDNNSSDDDDIDDDDDSSRRTVAQSHRVGAGRSQALERVYSRYEPNMDDIRPLPVLLRAFAHVQQRAAARERDEGRAAALKYLSEQLKGMRQDLHVQHIANAFAVRVYERHARLCLETRELGEFNQCQAALKQLYARVAADDKNNNNSNTSSKKRRDVYNGTDAEERGERALCNAAEFFYYRLVYLWLSEQHDALSTELIHFSNAHRRRERPARSGGGDRAAAAASRTATATATAVAAAAASRAGVQQTLLLCRACDEGDASALCRALAHFPREMRLLVAIYLQRLRVRWLRTMLCALKGNVSLRFVMASLGFTPTRVAATTTTPPQKQPRQACSNSSSNNNDDDDSLVWLDGSRDEAAREFAALLALLKLTPPTDFVFDVELARDARRDDGSSGSNAAAAATTSAAVPSIDAVTAMRCVEAYVTFLGTRRDAGIDDDGERVGGGGSSQRARQH